MFQSIGPTELIIVLVIVLVIFGPKRLPGLGKSLGSGMREFKDSITGKGRTTTTTMTTTRRSDDRRQANAALGRPEGEPSPRRGRGRLRAQRTLAPRPSRHRRMATPHCGRSRTRIGSASSSTSTSCARGSSSASAAFLVAFGVCFWQNDTILEIMDRPLEKSAFTDGQRGPARAVRGVPAGAEAALPPAGGAVRARWRRSDDLSPALRAQLGRRRSGRPRATAAAAPEAVGRRPVTLGVGEPFTVTFRVVGYAALLLALPLLLYQAYAFILPAFSPRERQVALPLMLMVPFLFVAGVVFAYYIVLPNAINFLQNFNDDNYDILLQARDFYKFSIMVLMAMGVAVPGPDRDPGGHARRDRHAARSCARAAATRSSSSRSSPCCCPARTP